MPNIHPLLVHFPIALLLAAVTADMAHVCWPRRTAVRDTATWLYCAGAMVAMAAYFSGLDAAGSLTLPAGSRTAVGEHFAWAERATWYFVVFASFRMALSYIWRSTLRRSAALSSLMGLVGLSMLLVAAAHGGRLVFRHGVAVRPVPATEPGWTIGEGAERSDEPAPRPRLDGDVRRRLSPGSPGRAGSIR